MKTAEDTGTAHYRETETRLAELRKSRQHVTAQIAHLSQSVESRSEHMLANRAEELIAGNHKNTESLELAQITLDDERAQLAKLQNELAAISLADRKLEDVLADLGRQVKVRSAQRVLTDYRAAAGILKDILVQAEAANDRLVALDRELRQSQLAEFGGKPLVLISRAGLSWNALSPIPIIGSPIHVSDWLTHVDKILGE